MDWWCLLNVNIFTKTDWSIQFFLPFRWYRCNEFHRCNCRNIYMWIIISASGFKACDDIYCISGHRILDFNLFWWFNLLYFIGTFLYWSNGRWKSGVVLYVSEISNDRWFHRLIFVIYMEKWKKNVFFSIRGRLGSILPLARNSGILIAYIAGASITYKYRPYFFHVCANYLFHFTIFSAKYSTISFEKRSVWSKWFWKKIFKVLRHYQFILYHLGSWKIDYIL